MGKQKSKKSWIMISVLVEQELAEHVASALSVIVPGGLVLESNYGGVFPHELDIVKVPVRVYGYLPVDKKLENRRQDITKALNNLAAIFPLPDPIYSPLDEQDWATAWQKDYQPIPLGSRLIVIPSWLENPAPERLPVYMDPGMAFGSGTHPTTQLSLILIEECLAENPAAEMFDIGCGSGILSIAGAKLGVSSVLGLDTDPDAIQVSLANAEKNQVGDRTSFALGSVKELIRKEFQFSRAPLVVANIIAPILTRLFEDGLRDIVSPAGNLILSGVLQEQLPGILTLLDDYGFNLKTQRQQGEWVGLWGSRDN
jgi:ribosomal protein L11 methyltransferase